MTNRNVIENVKNYKVRWTEINYRKNICQRFKRK